jgi:hypothetical protein
MIVEKRGEVTIGEEAKSVAGAFTDRFCLPDDPLGDFGVLGRWHAFQSCILDHQRPAIDEIFLYHNIFRRHAPISGALLPFFSQMR